MGQHHRQNHNNISREHRESIGEDENPAANQHSKGAIVGNYICEEMISPSSLLRSDRFARSKALAVVSSQGEERARVSEQARGRDDKTNSGASGESCQDIHSPMIEAANTMHNKKAGAIISADTSGVNGIRKRGKAPSKVRPMTTAGRCSKVRSTLGRVKRSEHGEHTFPPCQAEKAQKMSGDSVFSNIPAFESDFDAPPSNKVHSRGQICSSPSVGSDITDVSSHHRARLSQSPLRSFSTAFTSHSDGCFRQSPMRSKCAVASPDQMARKVSQLGPSSQLDDEWTSRCFKLTQQIVEQLRSWSQSSSSDGQISTSPILSRSQYSSRSSTSRDWVKGKQTLPDPVSVTRTLLEEFDQQSTSMDSMSQSGEVYSM
ncbi:unnamed protein product [Calypogeia fissa]